MYTLIGYQHKNYVSKASGKTVEGVNLFFSCPSRYDDVIGEEVLTEFVRPDILRDAHLEVGKKYNILYGRGYGGKALVEQVLPAVGK